MNHRQDWNWLVNKTGIGAEHRPYLTLKNRQKKRSFISGAYKDAMRHTDMKAFGILLKKQTDCSWENCRKNKVKIFISYYPIGLEYDEIIKTANKYLVKVNCEGKGTRTMRRDILDLEGKQDM